MFQLRRFGIYCSRAFANSAVLLKRRGIRAAVFLSTTSLSACGTWIPDNFPDGDLEGIATVEWVSEDYFAYLPDRNKPLSFQPSFWTGSAKRITPRLMYTDGGSVPRALWNIPGLSPWGFGPAYIIHDYIFTVHRCHAINPAVWSDPAVEDITFPQSAEVLAEVGKSLIDLGLIKHDALQAIVWAVRTQYAQTLWNQPGNATDCAQPPKPFAAGVAVAHFDVSQIRRQQLRMRNFR
jgi:hypothetical protein